VRAAAPNEIWHVDVTVLKLIDGTKTYLHAIIDNYSRKILAWTVAERLEPTATCQLLLAAGKHMVFAGLPLLFADSGIENINSAVDDTLFSACLERVLAQVDVAYSNSMIEAFWRSLKHQWLYLNSLDSIERLRVLVAFSSKSTTPRCHIRPSPARRRTRCTSARRSTCRRNWRRPGARRGRSVSQRTGR
jgi:putative transposase